MFYFWILFNVVAVALLVLDLYVFHKPGRAVKFRKAIVFSLMWIGLAAVFAVILHLWQGQRVALEFVTGYVVELSLSIDNLFLFLVIFRYFAVPERQQHQVLFWGIIGALILRGLFIGAGIGLIEHFHWIFYVFGVLLIYSGIRLAVIGEHQVEPAKNPVVGLVRRWLPITDEYHDSKFFVRSSSKGALCATPLLLVLIVIETTDLLFAVDSIPAILGITLNAFVVYTSNVLAIIGLRSLYFVAAGLMDKFRYLHHGLAVILVLIGAKMLVEDYYPVSTAVTLAAVAGVVTLSILASIIVPEHGTRSNQM